VTVRLIKDVHLYESLRSQFPTVVDVFDLFYAGSIDNVTAEYRLFGLFKIIDENWVKCKPVSTNLTSDYLKTSLCLGQPDDNGCRVFDWRYEQSRFCKCRGTTRKTSMMTMDNIFLFPEQFSDTVTESLRKFVQESTSKTLCSQCNDQIQIQRRTIVHPMVLHLSYVTSGANPQPNLPNHLEKEVDFDGKTYDIVGATYFGDSRFRLRYFLKPDVYEVKESPKSDLGDKAISIKIHDKYENALPGSFTDEDRLETYQIHDVFYRQRPDDYVEASDGLKK
jgi:hypothetical protein